MIKCHTSKNKKKRKKGKRDTADKVIYAQNVYNRKIGLLTMSQASNSKFYVI